MKELSEHNRNIVIAHEKGYRVCKDGKVINPQGKYRNPTSYSGYYYINIRIDGIAKSIKIHKLQAYQKFGDKIFEEGIVVRHLNGNSLDNSWDNIDIGTQKDNISDIPIEQMFSDAARRGITRRIYDYDAIIKTHNEGMSYNEIIRKFGYSGKGQVCYIINRYKYIRKTKRMVL